MKRITEIDRTSGYAWEQNLRKAETATALIEYRSQFTSEVITQKATILVEKLETILEYKPTISKVTEVVGKYDVSEDCDDKIVITFLLADGRNAHFNQSTIGACLETLTAEEIQLVSYFGIRALANQMKTKAWQSEQKVKHLKDQLREEEDHLENYRNWTNIVNS